MSIKTSFQCFDIVLLIWLLDLKFGVTKDHSLMNFPEIEILLSGISKIWLLVNQILFYQVIHNKSLRFSYSMGQNVY